jgi:hypothetical protein
MRLLFHQPFGRATLCGLAALVVLLPGLTAGAPAGTPWRGVHFWLDSNAHAQELLHALPALATNGVNRLVLEVNYSYEFKAHPELRQPRYIRQATARQLSQAAAACGIELIPEFNCLGHQSFGRRVEPLLRVHPEFNETPGLTPTNHGVYCLSWCPRAPGLDAIVFSLLDDLADGFQARALHVGLDEVYLIGAAECPRCRGRDPARLFADQVQRLHDHLVRDRKLTMLMWADRVIGPKYQGWSEYDRAENDLSPAIDWIPKDIIQCDWHYAQRATYPSLPFLTGKGFRVWPAGFQPVAAAQALSRYAWSLNEPRVLGYLATTWNETSITNAANWPPIREVLPAWRTQ